MVLTAMRAAVLGDVPQLAYSVVPVIAVKIATVTASALLSRAWRAAALACATCMTCVLSCHSLSRSCCSSAPMVIRSVADMVASLSRGSSSRCWQDRSPRSSVLACTVRRQTRTVTRSAGGLVPHRPRSGAYTVRCRSEARGCVHRAVRGARHRGDLGERGAAERADRERDHQPGEDGEDAQAEKGHRRLRVHVPDLVEVGGTGPDEAVA